ncbi:uncharacterized protein Z520_12032 [Fonsecaea multimorphosa CBS 102226]|uniref:Uncharacterized protein n=1 Tax=Fonsecaea multimorphosa CBS 102226 TaxID=1442371 RepID=A0A0D2I4W1_9EURO|nr:uncharacterized protein Z520_12032 [Fonsecaea multimorphosa CBS 102226]KIX92286.1 hypothetical protein Z520_12032 [Fonsecaea multimorphosa CBS 102226]OAL17657.1 hypothetical protein AYO22_11447 [Fonsecaea multimorphosa]
MSFRGNRGLSDKDNVAISRMPTGLRSRNTPSSGHRPVALSPPRSCPAQLVPLKPRLRPANSNASPVTPTTLYGETRKKSWVNSASKHLGLSKLRPKASFPREGIMNMDSTAAPGASLTKSLNVQPHNLSGSSRSPVPAPLSHPRHQSPEDKPLPSLPVATVKTKSPIRRSLIDCTERPLRRSLTPPYGGVQQQEDWPAIEPTKADTIRSEVSQSQVKPSLSESLYEGMRALDLHDDKEKIVQAEHNVEFKENIEPVAAATHFREANSAVTADSTTRPLSSSQLPKPRESLLRSLSSHVDSPMTQQTKTSALRLHQVKAIGGSIGEMAGSSGHIPPVRDRAESPSVWRSKQAFPGGPVRTNSRGRYGVTGRGSPYTIPTRSKSVQKTASRYKTSIDVGSSRNPVTDQGFGLAQRGTTTQQPSSPRQNGRKSSLPLPTRLTRQALDESSEGNMRKNSPSEPFMNIAVHELPGAGRPSSHLVEDFASNGVNENGNPSETTNKHKVELLNVKEMLSTTAPRDDESFVDSDGESGVSIHGYDSFGGYRVRRVGNGSRMGPTLRITDSASRVLLGQGGNDLVGKRSHRPSLNHKGSAPDIGSPRIAKDQVRRSSAIFSRPMSLVRNFTDRSLNLHHDADQDETQNLIGKDSSVDTVVRAELPDNSINFRMGQLGDLHTNVNARESTEKETSVYQTTPTSTQSDWPCKDFADFSTPSKPAAVTAKQKENASSSTTDGVITKRQTPSSSSRPPTIVLRAAPSKETAPFLFQDLAQEQAKQEKLVNDLAKATYDEVATVPEPKTTTPFPPRTSSRKPKPPPIIVSPPEHHPQSISFLAQRAPKAYAVNQDKIKKPRNVKTFSQSISPRTDSVKGRKISHVLAHSPSSSSKKTVISNIRGLFHKRSVESSKAATNAIESGAVSDEVNPNPAKAAGGPGSLRRKPVPTSTSGERDDKNVSCQLQVNSSDNGQTGQGKLKPTHESQATESQEQISRTGSRALRRKTPFISPTTPFTAGLNTSVFPTSPLETSAVAAKATAKKIASPTTHAHPQVRSPTTLSPTTPPTLAIATNMTHSLLDLARTSTDPTRKAHLIELSKCMVEVVSSARDAEKAMEKAKMEASRAECAWLKCLKDVGQVEGLIKGIVEFKA